MDHCFLMSFKGDRLVFLVHNEPGLKEEVFKLLFFLNTSMISPLGEG